ncbi:iron uptake transporter permease EfeU [Lichenibacterium ramalinae]|uniref:Iron transporter n=1 Tax=Lichenibacterium ramalinae TaxID=2316527 RepID=A0A4Q2RB78_9HYPH|nr:iron uptake transporter permease EfeU [Lichenibacterium ramalinae]RYB03680.1 iron transporter [Lichenibacterium ramalinae]
MLVAYLIMLREGIEAALIVGIVAGYLQQTGRSRFMPAVWAGVVLATAICLALGIAMNAAEAEFPQKQQEFFEGAVALVAVGVLTSMIFWMKKAARSIRSELHGSVEAALSRRSGGAMALVLMAFFAVGREGLESVFFLLATFQQDLGWGPPLGALLGVVSAVAFGAAVTYGGYRLDLRRFFAWTSGLIVFVAAGLLAGALRAFHEAGLWNGLQERAFDLSNVLPADGTVGTLLSGIFGYQDAPTVGEVAVYLAFLVPALWLLFAPGRPGVPAARPA